MALWLRTVPPPFYDVLMGGKYFVSFIDFHAFVWVWGNTSSGSCRTKKPNDMQGK